MAIQPTLKKSFIAWNLAYLIITGGLGAWGGYDYWVTIPENEQRAVEWDALVTENQDLTNKAQTGTPLSVEEKNRYEEILLILETTYQNTAPQPPAAYDRPLNFWATSSAWAMRPRGTLLVILSILGPSSWAMGVSISPGWIELTLTPLRANSTAAVFVIPLTAHLEAP